MKIKYHCSCSINDIEIIKLLEMNNMPYKLFNKSLIFDFFDDHPVTKELMLLVDKAPEPKIVHGSAVFSKEEMENANWFSMLGTRCILEPRKYDYTFQFSCTYTNMYGITKHKHRTQINPFVAKNVPPWKTKFNFCSEDCGDFTMIFCSDFAKQKIEENNINGIDFWPVLKGDLKTNRENIHQLGFPNKLSLDAFNFIGKYRENICPFCGKVNYIFEMVEGDNIRIKTDLIPEGIDAFETDFFINEGWGDKIIVVSKKVYNVIANEMKERHIRFIPIG